MPFLLGLATDDEITALCGRVYGDCGIKDVLDDWRLVAVRGIHPHPGSLPVTEAVFGIGRALLRGRTVCTSSVVGLDRGAALLRTRSGSLYFLGNAATGPLPEALSWALAHHLMD